MMKSNIKIYLINGLEMRIYDENYFLFEKDLSETELDYFKVLLILFGLINNNKIHNFINKDLGEKLRRSPDEELRIGINL